MYPNRVSAHTSKPHPLSILLVVVFFFHVLWVHLGPRTPPSNINPNASVSEVSLTATSSDFAITPNFGARQLAAPSANFTVVLKIRFSDSVQRRRHNLLRVRVGEWVDSPGQNQICATQREPDSDEVRRVLR